MPRRLIKRFLPNIHLESDSKKLLLGTALALLWANLHHVSYEHVVHWHIFGTGVTPHFLATDLLMALFFAAAAKEVFESFLPGGALSSPRKAALPLMATLGGMAGPAGLYLLGCWFWDKSELYRGWAVPCATDIAFSYLIARIIFGSRHPAVAFLLLLAIADDAAGLIIIAVVYPPKPMVAWWLLLTLAAIVSALVMKKKGVRHFGWYMLPGAASWISFLGAGIHPALGLVPIIPCMPHARTDLGIFAGEELKRRNTLDRFERFFNHPIEYVLLLFALTNAGVPIGDVGAGTSLVLVGLLAGKPLGIGLFTAIGEFVFGLQRPAGMSYRDIFVVGMVAAIGFTVALFVSTAAFRDPKYAIELAEVKMGALASLIAAVIALVAAKSLGIRPQSDDTPAVDSTSDEQREDQLPGHDQPSN